MVKNFLKKCGDALKNIASNMNSNNSGSSENFASKNSDSFDNQNFTEKNSDEDRSSQESSSTPEFDINMIMKMKTIMDSIKTNKNDPRANLLKSLKPYLNKNRKDKVDQYIQLFNMSKAFEVLNPLGGDSKKNDV